MESILFLNSTFQKLFQLNESSFCQCQGDVHENPDFIDCEEKAAADFYECIANCGIEDLDCRVECNRVLAELVENCPCNVSFRPSNLKLKES